MRRRIGIALALCNEPDVIVPGPTTALDAVQAQILHD